MRMVWKIAGYGALGIVVLLIAGLALLYYQGKRDPGSNGDYVALGSSFAAGIGLGARVEGSPLVCMRTVGSYPQLLAKKAGLRLLDMTCSGSTTRHILHGGQVFLGPQLDGIGPDTKLVTITTGGNDVGYIGDLMSASGSYGMLGAVLGSAPKPLAERDFAGVTASLAAIVGEVRGRAPRARVAIVTYPPVLPETGSCAALGISPQQADLSRQVAAGLLEATRAAAAQSGAVLVDMASLGAGHDACSAEPWTYGARPASGTAFHPTPAGAEATANAVHAALFEAR
jgi:lysophospholipase L1-like esterase